MHQLIIIPMDAQQLVDHQCMHLRAYERDLLSAHACLTTSSPCTVAGFLVGPLAGVPRIDPARVDVDVCRQTLQCEPSGRWQWIQVLLLSRLLRAWYIYTYVCIQICLQRIDFEASLFSTYFDKLSDLNGCNVYV